MSARHCIKILVCKHLLFFFFCVHLFFFNVLFVSSTFAVSISIYIYFLSLHLSHSQTQAAGRQALKDPWLIWPINCHCQGREGEGERVKKSLPSMLICSFRKKERKKERMKGQRYSPTSSSYPPHHLSVVLWASHWLTLPRSRFSFLLSSLFPRSGSLLLHRDTSCYAMKLVWQLLSLKSFNILKLPPVPQATAVWQQSLTEN